MKTIAYTAIGALLLAGAANAEQHTYQYTGTVSKITARVGLMDEATLTTVTMPVGLVTLGESITGTFAYDTAAEGAFVQWPFGAEGQFMLDAATNPHSIAFGGGVEVGGTSQTGAAIIRVWDNFANDADPEAGDGFGLYTYHFSGSLMESLSLSLQSTDKSILSSPALQEATKFNAGVFSYRYSDSYEIHPGQWASYAWEIEGEVTSVTQVSAVPEPGTYAMLLAGLGIVGWRRRAARLK